MQISDRRDSPFRFHIFGDEFHRAGSIKRDQRDDVVELLNVELLRQTCHPAGFHLEEADRFASVVESEGGFVVHRNVLERKIRVPFVNECQRVLDHG